MSQFIGKIVAMTSAKESTKTSIFLNKVLCRSPRVSCMQMSNCSLTRVTIGRKIFKTKS